MNKVWSIGLGPTAEILPVWFETAKRNVSYHRPLCVQLTSGNVSYNHCIYGVVATSNLPRAGTGTGVSFPLRIEA